MSILDESPFPFFDPNGENLQRVMAGIYTDRNEALALAGRFGVNPLAIPKDLAPIDLWHCLLERLATAGKVRRAVQETRDRFPGNQHVPFLDALLAVPAADSQPVVPSSRSQQSGASLWSLVIQCSRFLSAQRKFFAGLAFCLGAVALLLVFIADDELAIKLLYEGSTAKFVNVRYDLRKPPAGGLDFQELKPGGDGFIRIAHRDIAEPPNVSLVINDVLLPPRFTGNDRQIMLRVDKLNYEEAGFPLWKKTRQLFLDVKVEFVEGRAR